MKRHSKIEIRKILPDTTLTCFVIPSLYSKSECERLLSSEIMGSFQKAISNYPTHYRNNDRFLVDNDDLSDELFLKVKTYLPKVIETGSGIEGENGVWHLEGLNNRLRFCRYSTGQYFNRHLDGVHYGRGAIQSKLTFMIYLNGAADFKGGRTMFFKTKCTIRVIKILDLDHIATGGEDNKVKIWRMDGQLIAVFEHQNFVQSIEILDSQTLMSASYDGTIKTWKIEKTTRI